MNKRWILSLVFLLSLCLPGCRPAQKTPVVVFAAGSLITPFNALEKEFEAANPDLDLQMEYHGSIQVIRHVTDIHEKIDVVATADADLIPMLMYSANDEESGQPYAGWYIRFATNKLGIAYSERSQFADEINAQNWTEILSRPGVRVGIADPRFDAAGYRAMMVYKLAEKAYAQPDLFYERFRNQFTSPLKVITEAGTAVIRIPEIVQPKPGASIVIRGASIELIALLESGDLDYAFEYESVIRQHKLNLLALPDELNLGAADREQEYGRVAVRLDFQRFARVKPEFKGARIAYGITIPANAPNPSGAERFIAYLLGPEGRRLMDSYAHPLFDSPTGANYEAIPKGLQGLCRP